MDKTNIFTSGFSVLHVVAGRAIRNMVFMVLEHTHTLLLLFIMFENLVADNKGYTVR